MKNSIQLSFVSFLVLICGVGCQQIASSPTVQIPTSTELRTIEELVNREQVSIGMLASSVGQTFEIRDPLNTFSWPPPQGANRLELTPYFQGTAPDSYADVSRQLMSALREACFQHPAIYPLMNSSTFEPVPGFAILTTAEEVLADGSIHQPREWRPTDFRVGQQGLLSRLWPGERKKVRMIVFVVTPKQVNWSHNRDQLAESEAVALLQGGLSSLGDYGARRFSSDDAVWALVYEFEASAAQRGNARISRNPLSVYTHLEGAGLGKLLSANASSRVGSCS